MMFILVPTSFVASPSKPRSRHIAPNAAGKTNAGAGIKMVLAATTTPITSSVPNMIFMVFISLFFSSNGSGGDRARVYRDPVHWPRIQVQLSKDLHSPLLELRWYKKPSKCTLSVSKQEVSREVTCYL